MKKFFATLVAVAVLAVSGFSLAACSRDTSNVVFAISSDWGSLDPYTSTNSMMSHYLVLDKIYDKLVYINEDGELEPRAAKSWELSDDGYTLTFQLDENAAWHDGESVTADDWIWTLEYMTSGSSNITNHGFGRYLSGVDSGTGVRYEEEGVESDEAFGVTKDGDYTLILTFNQQITDVRTWFINAATTVYVLPEHLLDDLDYDDVMYSSYFDLPVGSGPCVVQSVEAGNNIVTVANENYQLGAPGFEKLTIQVVSSDVWVSSIAAGTVDVVQSTVSPNTISGYESNSNLQTRSLSDEVDSGINMVINCNKVPTKIRQAIDRAIDKDRIADVLYSGYGEASYSIILPSNQYYAEGIGYRDTDEAAELVQEAIAEGYWESDDVLNIYYSSTAMEPLATLVEANLEAIGLNVEIHMGDTNTINSYMFSDTDGYECQIVNLGTTSELPTTILLTYLAAYESYGYSHTHLSSADSKTGYETAYSTFESLYYAMVAGGDDLADVVKAFQEWEFEYVPQSELVTYSTVEISSSRMSGVDTFASTYYNMATWKWAIS